MQQPVLVVSEHLSAHGADRRILEADADADAGVRVLSRTGAASFPGFDVKARSEIVYGQRVWPLVRGFLDGRSVNVALYGTARAGKSGAARALLGLALADVFASIASYAAAHAAARPEFGVTLTLLEVRNEDAVDVLRGDSVVLLDGSSGVECVGAESVAVDSPAAALAIIQAALDARNPTTSSTRSHLIYTITLRQHHHDPETIITSRLRFFDLASSSRVKLDNHCTTPVLINSGLLALQNIVMGVADADYRQSKLTLLMKDSLVSNGASR
ncbi:P-loop containing nucleoside triphosphate hydrolase protein [Obelidium mucronatum]|nr:P-loop containing nucleoside triphosphate hydrolase protein [Obelidium mucronatum]